MELSLLPWKIISFNVRIFVARFPNKATKPMIQNNERRIGLAIISYLSENRGLHSSKPVSQSCISFWTHFCRLILVFHFRSKTFLSAQLTTFISTSIAVFNSITNKLFADGNGASSSCANESFVQAIGACFVRIIVTMSQKSRMWMLTISLLLHGNLIGQFSSTSRLHLFEPRLTLLIYPSHTRFPYTGHLRLTFSHS